MSAVLGTSPLGFPWQTADPFLFCVHHDDRYPAGNEALGPAASLAGRELGMDFEGKDGWRMYHGEVVPGFPQHPHRGFETVTIVRHGFIDHSDSLGATARFGGGDVQWLTAGRGVVHSEMFPLLERERGNPLELFQIWLNLPHADKMVDPHFAMLWQQDIPRETFRDGEGKTTVVTRIAGAGGAGAAQASAPPPPPPRSWAARPDSDVAIWTIEMEPGARWTLPAARAGTNRNLYFFRGDSLRADGQPVARYHSVALRPDAEVPLHNDHPGSSADVLLLQARPINEPVVQHGPFVMSSPEEIRQAMLDYHRTGFGDWPWPSDAPVHARDAGRFARHADGRVERAG